MDALLARAGSQAVSLVLRSGINIAGAYAIGTMTKFLNRLPEKDKADFERIKERLQTKIQIITPAIDLIELNAARGNNSLGTTLELTRELKLSIERFQRKLESLETEKNLKSAMDEVMAYSTDILARIEESIPLINLALTTSGANLTSGLPNTVSPGRLLQASRLLAIGDKKYEAFVEVNKKSGSTANISVQIGPEYFLTIYTVYSATAHTDAALGGGAEIAWKEDYVKATARLKRVSNGPTEAHSKKYSYKLIIQEDFDDGRYHDLEESKPRTREIDVSTIMKLSFTASGKLLEIEESNSPVLTLKMNKDYSALVKRLSTARSVLDRTEEDKFHKDMAEREEWIALEIFNTEDPWEDESDIESLTGDDTSDSVSDVVSEDSLTSAMKSMSLEESKSSLSLLEYLLRLSALQSNDQESIYSIQDERIALYLRDDKASRTEPESAHSPSAVSTPPSASNSLRKGYRRVSGHHRTNKFSASLSPNAGFPRATPRTPMKQSGVVPSSGPDGTPLTPWEQDRFRTQLFKNVIGTDGLSPSKPRRKTRLKNQL